MIGLRWLLVLGLCALGALGQYLAAEDRVRDGLRDLNPMWYDARGDTWQRAAPRSEEIAREAARQRGEDVDGQASGEATGGTDGSSDGWDADSGDRRSSSSSSGGLVSAGGSGFGSLIVIVAVVALAAVVVALGVLAWLEWQRDPQQDRDQATGNGGEVDDRLVVPRFLELDLDESSRGDIQGALDQALAAGDWDRAVVCAYAASLVTLDAHAMIRLQRGTTNRGFLREARTAVGATRPLVDAFSDAIAVFERVYFGSQPAQPDDAKRLAAWLQALRQGAGGLAA